MCEPGARAGTAAGWEQRGCSKGTGTQEPDGSGSGSWRSMRTDLGGGGGGGPRRSPGHCPRPALFLAGRATQCGLCCRAPALAEQPRAEQPHPPASLSCSPLQQDGGRQRDPQEPHPRLPALRQCEVEQQATLRRGVAAPGRLGSRAAGPAAARPRQMCVLSRPASGILVPGWRRGCWAVPRPPSLCNVVSVPCAHSGEGIASTSCTRVPAQVAMDVQLHAGPMWQERGWGGAMCSGT